MPGQRWWLALLGCAVAMTAWCSRPAVEAVPAEAPATYHYVPLLGASLDDVIDEADGDRAAPPREVPAGPVKTCLPFLAPILRYPNWQLRITAAYSTCFGPVVRGDFTIASTGEVTWTMPGGPARHLALSSEQLALVQRLDRLSCVELEHDAYDHDWLLIGLDLGKFDEYGGARISPASELGRTVTAMLDELTAQYREPRRELIGSMDLRLATTEPGAAPFRIRVTGGHITVERGRKRLIDVPAEPDLVLDLVDAVLERRFARDPDVTGELLMNGWSFPVALERQVRGPFASIYWALDGARNLDAEQRERGMRGMRAATD